MNVVYSAKIFSIGWLHSSNCSYLHIITGQLIGDLRLVDNSGEQEAPLADWRSITVDNGGQCVMTASA